MTSEDSGRHSSSALSRRRLLAGLRVDVLRGAAPFSAPSDADVLLDEGGEEDLPFFRLFVGIAVEGAEDHGGDPPDVEVAFVPRRFQRQDS